MKTETLIELQRSITQGKWATDIKVAIEIIDKEGRKAIDFATVYQGEGPGKGSEICALRHDPDDGLDLHDEQYKADTRAITLVPELIAEVIRLREALRAMLAVQSELPPPMSDNAGYTDYCLRIVAAEDKASAALANDK